MTLKDTSVVTSSRCRPKCQAKASLSPQTILPADFRCHKLMAPWEAFSKRLAPSLKAGESGDFTRMVMGLKELEQRKLYGQEGDFVGAGAFLKLQLTQGLATCHLFLANVTGTTQRRLLAAQSAQILRRFLANVAADCDLPQSRDTQSIRMPEYLDERLIEEIGHEFKSGNTGRATHFAYRAVESNLRHRLELKEPELDCSHLTGRPLFERAMPALVPDHSPLHPYKKKLQQFFQGAFAAFRNPASASNPGGFGLETFEVLCVANLQMKISDGLENTTTLRPLNVTQESTLLEQALRDFSKLHKTIVTVSASAFANRNYDYALRCAYAMLEKELSSHLNGKQFGSRKEILIAAFSEEKVFGFKNAAERQAWQDLCMGAFSLFGDKGEFLQFFCGQKNPVHIIEALSVPSLLLKKMEAASEDIMPVNAVHKQTSSKSNLADSPIAGLHPVALGQVGKLDSRSDFEGRAYEVFAITLERVKSLYLSLSGTKKVPRNIHYGTNASIEGLFSTKSFIESFPELSAQDLKALHGLLQSAFGLIRDPIAHEERITNSSHEGLEYLRIGSFLNRVLDRAEPSAQSELQQAAMGHEDMQYDFILMHPRIYAACCSDYVARNYERMTRAAFSVLKDAYESHKSNLTRLEKPYVRDFVSGVTTLLAQNRLAGIVDLRDPAVALECLAFASFSLRHLVPAEL